MEELFDNIRHFRGFSFSRVEKAFGLELSRSIVKMLMKLNVKENEIFVYNPKLASSRGVTLHGCGTQPFFGILYKCHKKMPQYGEYETFEMDGKFYELWDFWKEGDFPIPNCSVLQPSCVKFIELHYNYLRLEIGKKPSDRKFSIMPWD